MNTNYFNSNNESNENVLNGSLQDFQKTNLETQEQMRIKKKLQSFTSSELIQKFSGFVSSERKNTYYILVCINEIDLRKLYLELGYSSLFDYLTKKMGYAPASAMRRIDGARLLRQLPELGTKIESGEINLTQVSILQKSIRTAFDAKKDNNQSDVFGESDKSSSHQKTQNSNLENLFIINTENPSQKPQLSLDEKRELLNKISNATTKQTELIVAQALNIEAPKVEVKTQVYKNESQSLTILFSKEEMELLTQVRDLVSNATQSTSLKDAILYLAKREVKRRSSSSRSQTQTHEQAQVKNSAFVTEVIKDHSKNIAIEASLEEVTECQPGDTYIQKPTLTPKSTSKPISTQGSAQEIPSNSNSSIPRSIYKQVLKPGMSCEYSDPSTHKRCGAILFLNVDHIHSRCDGGSHDLKNLRILCSSHNKWRYKMNI